MLKIQSNGIGQQSMALYFMSSTGIVPRFDYSVFADPGREKKESYEYIRYAIEWASKYEGVPIIWTGKKSLFRDLMKGTNSGNGRFAPIPAYTLNPDGTKGILRRQCTNEYKIAEFNKVVRQLTGITENQNYPWTKIYNAITVEELDRVAINDIAKFINVYPFCNLQTNSKLGTKFLNYDIILGRSLYARDNCVAWLKQNGFEVPPKSACTFCPYQADAQWLDTKINDPKEWKALIKLDNHIRHSSVKGIDNPIFLHKSCVSLEKVELKQDQTQAFKECEGNCDV